MITAFLSGLAFGTAIGIVSFDLIPEKWRIPTLLTSFFNGLLLAGLVFNIFDDL